ncbi:MAG: cupredoxin domain-containing protein, partial [Acidimicrobiales bacterium]
FDNRDRGTYHNVAVYGANGTTPLWAGEPISGVRKIVYQTTFDLAPGSYTFRCNFHPTSMVGTFIVQPASSPSATP